MLYLTHDHVHSELLRMLSLKDVEVSYVLPHQMETVVRGGGGGGEEIKILHISNPISDRLYNIDRYKDDDKVIVHKPENNTDGNWKQCLLTYIRDFPYLHTIERMLNDNEYMLKYVEYMSKNKYKDIKGNIQYTAFIKDILTMINVQ
uniref:Uncharacterized protein n=1 Tax=Panulirus argus virus 1 TaxID=380624 RepID=A0A6G9HF34_9VIRU|nr:hypothetical protein [Panulirus argus virus 1]